MSEPDLPAELAEMEGELHAALGTAPGETLRGRVLSAMRAELRGARRRATLSFLVGTAAAALLWINLSMSLVNNTWQIAAAPAGDGVEEIAARMRTLMPELSDAEARRQAATALARTELAPAGALPVPVYARNEPWDTH
jgi:hypothetical protein